MLSCQEYQLLCHAALDGMLPEAENQQLQSHLRTCAVCQAYWEDMCALRDLWQTTAQPAPEGLHASIMQAVDRERNVIIQKPNKIARPRFAMWVGVAACLVLVVSGTLGNFLGKQVVPAVENHAVVAAESAPDAPVAPMPAAAPPASESRRNAEPSPAPMQVDAPPAAMPPQTVTVESIPESLHSLSFADVYVVQSAGEVHMPEECKLLETSAQAQYYGAENSTAVLEKIIATLTDQGLMVATATDVPLPLSREAEQLLWIVYPADGE